MTIIIDSIKKRSRGYAFIEYENEEDMKKAFKEADRIKIDGRRVVIDVERGRTVSGWKPKRIGGGLGSKRIGGRPRFIRTPSSRPVSGRGGRDRGGRGSGRFEGASGRGGVDRKPRDDQNNRVEGGFRGRGGDRDRPPRSPRRGDRVRSPRRDDRVRSPRRDDRARSPRRDDRTRSPRRDRTRSPRRDDRTRRDRRVSLSKAVLV